MCVWWWWCVCGGGGSIRTNKQKNQQTTKPTNKQKPTSHLHLFLNGHFPLDPQRVVAIIIQSSSLVHDGDLATHRQRPTDAQTPL